MLYIYKEKAIYEALICYWMLNGMKKKIIIKRKEKVIVEDEKKILKI
jgi:hypothetical protein